MNNLKLKAILLSALVSISSVAFSGPILWTSDGSGNLGTVDVTTGDVNVIGSMNIAMTDIAFDSSGNLFGISSDYLYSINTTTAATSFIGSHNLGSGAKNSLVFGADDTLYAANNSLYSLDVGSGSSTLIGSGGGAYSSSGDLAFIGDSLFLSSSHTSTDSLVELDTGTGVGTTIGDIGVGSVWGMATDNNLDLYGIAGTTLLSINAITGAGTLLLNFGGNGLGASWGTAFYGEAGATVPEPASIALLLLGLAGLQLSRRKFTQS